MIGIIKNQIYETVFETIKESTEWGINDDGKTYGHWVDGVVTFADALLDKLSEEKNCRLTEKH